MKKYTIECNEEQLRLIARALESHSRMRCGQLGSHYQTALQEAEWDVYDLKGAETFHYVSEEVQKRLDEIKHLVWGLVPNESWGIGFNHTADLGYEMYKIILSQFEKEHAEDCKKKGEVYHGNVHTGTPLKLTEIPFINVTLTNVKGKEKKEKVDFPSKNKNKKHKYEKDDRHLMLMGTLNYERGEKVVFIPDGTVYDFGYRGATGKAIVYNEGECNGQDSHAVDWFNIRKK